MKRYLRKKVLYLAFGIAQIFWFGGVLTAQTSSNGNTSVPPQTQVTGDIYGQINVIGDVDGDGVKDVIFGATDGKVHIYSSATGKEIVRPPYWPKQTGGPFFGDVQVTSSLRRHHNCGLKTEKFTARQPRKEMGSRHKEK